MINIAPDQLNQTRSLLEQSQDILVLVPKNPTLDNVAAALSLYLALSSQGKRVSAVCPDQMTVEFSHLTGVDKVAGSFSGGQGRNLVISFPYQEGSIEKVSYNIENSTFNLVIEPREGYPQITPDLIRYSFAGGNTDLIVTIGAASPSDFAGIYTANQALFTEKPVINIDFHSNNSRYGKVNIVDSTATSSSELMTSILSLLGVTMSVDLASNLLAGITGGSQNFTSTQTTANTFEAAAVLLKNGARKIATSAEPASISQAQYQTQTANPFPQQSRQQTNQPQSQHQAQPQQFNQKPQQYFGRNAQQQQSVKPKPVQQPPVRQPADQAPPDWLKPKIYKGSSLL